MKETEVLPCLPQSEDFFCSLANFKVYFYLLSAF